MRRREGREGRGQLRPHLVSPASVHPKPNDVKSDEELSMPVRPDCPVPHGIGSLAVFEEHKLTAPPLRPSGACHRLKHHAARPAPPASTRDHVVVPRRHYECASWASESYVQTGQETLCVPLRFAAFVVLSPRDRSSHAVVAC